MACTAPTPFIYCCSYSIYAEVPAEVPTKAPSTVTAPRNQYHNLNHSVPKNITRNTDIKRYLKDNGKKIRRANRVRFAIASILFLCSVVGCHLMILLVLSNSTPQEANIWLLKYLISLGQDMIVGQLAKAAIQIFCIRTLANGRTSSTLRKFCQALLDPLVARVLAANTAPVKTLSQALRSRYAIQ